jgi:hypothetical protein
MYFFQVSVRPQRSDTGVVVLELGDENERQGIAAVRQSDEVLVNTVGRNPRLLRLLARVEAIGTRVLDDLEYRRNATICWYFCQCPGPAALPPRHVIADSLPPDVSPPHSPLAALQQHDSAPM